MDLRSVGTGEQGANFVARPVELGRLAAGGAVEEIDEAPGDILGIGFESGIGEHREEVRPGPGKRLVDRVVAGKIGLVERRGLDA